jgi:hypothetical protein
MLHTPAMQAAQKQPLTVEGSLANAGKVDRVIIRYRGPAEDYLEVPMEFKYGDLYRGTIPGPRMTPPGVEYYIEGVSSAGERIPLFMTPGKPARVFVTGQSPDADGGEKVPEPPAKAKPSRKDSKR